MFKSTLIVFLAVFTLASAAQAQTPRRKAPAARPAKYEYRTPVASTMPASPWDFSAMLGLYNPGVGFGALAAYRILDQVLHEGDNSLSFESGINFVSVSDSVASSSVSYTLIEIPFQARWDFRLSEGKLIVGPRAGFNYLSGSSVTINNVNYTISRSGGIFFQLGGFGMYRFTENLAARIGIGFGGYTSIMLGLNYAL